MTGSERVTIITEISMIYLNTKITYKCSKMPTSIHLFEHNSPKNCLVIFGVAIGLFDIQLY